MKTLRPLFFAGTIVLFAACNKQQSEAERQAEINRQVEQRLASERQAQQQQQLDQREADVKAREDALASQQQQPVETTPVPSAPEETFATTTAETETESATTAPNAPPSRHRARGHSTQEYGMFYEKLEPYGDWIETNDYGYVWQPRAAQESHGWRPYTDGHWVYTEAGWTWVSDEPFGWAAYHYGRWARLRGVGWVWVPGKEWAPAWVSWRTSSQYVGWAPLPPEAEIVRGEQVGNWADSYYDIGPEQYVFVPTNEVGVQRVTTAAVPVDRNVTIMTETRNVTNITYNNTTVVNQGPSYDQLRAVSRQPIERYQLQRETVVQGQPQPVVRGQVIAFPAPPVAPIPNVQRPPVVKKTIPNAVVENGWSGVSNRAAAEQAKAKVMAEATPPPNAPPKAVAQPQTAPAATASPGAATASSTPVAGTTPIAATTPQNTMTPRQANAASATTTPAATAAPSRPTFSPRPSISPRASATAAPQASATAAERTSPTSVASPSATVATVSPTPRPFVRPSVSPRGSIPQALTPPGAAKSSPTATAAGEKPAAAPTGTIPTRAQHTPPTVPSASAAQTPPALSRFTPPAQPAERDTGADALKREQLRSAKQHEPAQITPALRPSPTASPQMPRVNPVQPTEKAPALRATPANARPEHGEPPAPSPGRAAERASVPPQQHTPPAMETPPARMQPMPQQQHSPSKSKPSPSPTVSAAP